MAGNPEKSFMAGKTQGKLFVFDVSRILYRMVIRFELKKQGTFDVTFVFSEQLFSCRIHSLRCDLLGCFGLHHRDSFPN